MTGGDRYEPLWADSLADQPRPDVIARVVEEPDDELRPAPEQPPAGRRAPALAAVIAVAGALVLLLALQEDGSMTVVDVPSYWNEIPMTCHTVRVEEGDGAVEWFACRALTGERLPPGLYRSPGSQWTSDITRRDARESSIRISSDGQLVGSATY